MTPLLAQRSRVDRSFERLYRRHVADVYHYALAVLRNAADAEDVTQTTFLNAYRAYQRGERPEAAQNWLIAIAHNVCRQRFRQSTRRPQEVAFEEDVADAIVDDDAPSAQDIRNALGHLAFNQRAALVMRELEGRSYAEIGEILELSVSAVETLIFRARRALREQLEGSLTCGQAELAISKQVDGRLARSERGALRAHLRECRDCAKFARSQRAQRTAFKALGAAPLPTSLTSLSSLFGGGAAVGVGIAAKTAAVVAASALVASVGYEGARQVTLFKRGRAPVARVSAAPARASDAQPVSAAASAGPGVSAVAAVSRSAANSKQASAPKGRAKAKSATASAKRARGSSSSAKAAANVNGHAQRSASSNAVKSNRGSQNRSGAQRSSSRGRLSTAPGRTKQTASSPSTSRGRRTVHSKPSVKTAAVPKPKPAVPPGQLDKAPKLPKPPKTPEPPAATASGPPPASDAPGPPDKKK